MLKTACNVVQKISLVQMMTIMEDLMILITVKTDLKDSFLAIEVKALQGTINLTTLEVHLRRILSTNLVITQHVIFVSLSTITYQIVLTAQQISKHNIDTTIKGNKDMVKVVIQPSDYMDVLVKMMLIILSMTLI